MSNTRNTSSYINLAWLIQNPFCATMVGTSLFQKIKNNVWRIRNATQISNTTKIIRHKQASNNIDVNEIAAKGNFKGPRSHPDYVGTFCFARSHYTTFRDWFGRSRGRMHNRCDLSNAGRWICEEAIAPYEWCWSDESWR